jgi:hypothetical protein
MIKTGLAAATVLTMTAMAGHAQSPPTSVMTPLGSGLVTARTGSTASVMIPGSPVNGLLVPNGNGTSSLMIPGQLPATVPTPR